MPDRADALTATAGLRGEVPWIAALASGRTEEAVDAGCRERAFACEEAGTALARAGRDEEATALLREALAAYRALGAARDATRTRAALTALRPLRRPPRRSADAPGTAWDRLTESELRVVRLARDGLTNREIGRRLFVSIKTVETHLSNSYRKLCVCTRAQLATEARRRGLD